MDADVKRMLEDLGLGRRDVVSAPCVDQRGREIFDDQRRQTAVLAETEARRKRYTANVSEENEQARRLSAWNTPSTFEPDATAADLEDRYGGQGHRASLAHRLHRTEDPWEAIDLRFGEERRLYLQQKGGDARNYACSAKPSHSPLPRRPALRNVSLEHPRHVQAGLPRQILPDRGRVSLNGTTVGRRALSPRLHGTVRFAPSGKRSGTVDGATPAAPLSTPLSTIQAVSTMQSIPVHAQLPQQATLQASGSQGASSSDSYIQSQICNARARWYVANPGKECDAYYERNPSEITYYSAARDALIREVMELARAGDDNEMRRYVETHKERQWMVDTAKEVKLIIETGNDADINALVAANPRSGLFMIAGRVIFTRQKSSALESHCIGTSTKLQIPEGIDMLCESTTTKRGQAFVGPSPGQKDSTSHADRRDSYFGIVVNSSPISAEKSSYVPSTQASEIHKNKVQDRDSRSFGHSEGAFDLMPHSSPHPAPQTSILGRVTARFYNVLGGFLGMHEVETKTPVHAKLDLTSRSSGYDPRVLVEGIDSLVEELEKRSNGVFVKRRTVGQASLGEGGLWEEDIVNVVGIPRDAGIAS